MPARPRVRGCSPPPCTTSIAPFDAWEQHSSSDAGASPRRRSGWFGRATRRRCSSPRTSPRTPTGASSASASRSKCVPSPASRSSRRGWSRPRGVSAIACSRRITRHGRRLRGGRPSIDLRSSRSPTASRWATCRQAPPREARRRLEPGSNAGSPRVIRATPASATTSPPNWQWAAGTGVDSRPGRTFNPTLQAQRYDRSGDYVRRWIPELRGIPGAAVHEPWRLGPLLSGGYPAPIVDHAAAAARYRARG